jgi:hypothetical protein
MRGAHLFIDGNIEPRQVSEVLLGQPPALARPRPLAKPTGLSSSLIASNGRTGKRRGYRGTRRGDTVAAPPSGVVPLACSLFTSAHA